MFVLLIGRRHLKTNLGTNSTIYKKDWLDNFAKEINKASSSNDTEVLIFGDFNIDYLQEVPTYWSTVFEQFDFEQIITNPTRVSRARSTLIDHIYANKPNRVSEINVPCISMSDHYPVCITRQLPQKNHKTKPLEIKYRDFKNFDEKSFLKDLSESEILEVTKMNNPNDALGKLYSCFLDTLKKHAKMKSKRVKQQFKRG